MSTEVNKVADVEVNVQEQSSNANISPENEINWKKFREDRAKERAAMQEAQAKAAAKEEEARALKAALEAVVNKPSQQNYAQEVDETEEQRLDRLIEDKWQKKQAKERDDRAKQEAQELPQKMGRTFKDFDSVCSQENIDYLEYHHPEIHRALKKLPDSFDNWSDIYHTMKKLIPNADSKADAKKAEKNFNKPQSMSVAGSTQTSDHAPQMLTDAKRAANWKRMQANIRRT